MKKSFILLILLIGANISFSQTEDNYKTAVMRYIKVSKGFENFQTSVKKLFEYPANADTGRTKDFVKNMEQVFLDITIEEYCKYLIEKYKEKLTAADFNQISDFYESPLGTKYAEAMPNIIEGSENIRRYFGFKVLENFDTKTKDKK